MSDALASVSKISSPDQKGEDVKMLPSNEEAEQSLLGALLLDNRLIESVSDHPDLQLFGKLSKCDHTLWQIILIFPWLF